MTVRVVSCPQCGKPARWDLSNSFRPFCCERCRLIDLGAWASENYRIPVADPVEDAESENPEPPLN